MRVTVTGTRRISDQLQRWSRARTGSAPRPVERVQRREIPYWQERGWIRDGDRYTGSYQTPYGAFRGLIDEHGPGNAQFYLFAPPSSLRWSSHWACFQPRNGKGYLVHMARRPADVSSGILTIERLLTESLQPSPIRSVFHDLTRACREFLALD
jgi:hypothetical protein